MKHNSSPVTHLASHMEGALSGSAGGSPATSKSIEDNGSLSSCMRICYGNPGRAGRPRSGIFLFCIAFAALAAKAALPSGYTELEYIYMEGGASSGQQNDTATHYINTGIVPSGDWSVNAKFASTNTVAANTVYSTLFCARTAGNANSFLFWPHVGSSTAEGVARIDVGSGQTLSRNFIGNCKKCRISIGQEGI